MKKLLSMLLVSVFMITTLVGCGVTTLNPDGTTTTSAATPQQIVAQICGPTQAALTVLNAPGALSPALKADLNTITPTINTVCAVGATVDMSSLATFATTGLPGILQLVSVAPMPEGAKAGVIVGIAVAQAILSNVIANNPQVAVANKSVAPPIGVLPGVKAVLAKK